MAVESTTILTEPYRANTSDGNWAVRVRDDWIGGGSVEYGRHFWRKREAVQWIKDHKPQGGVS